VVYLDYNATTPVDPQVLEHMYAIARQHWHNPSSQYKPAKQARELLEQYRERFARCLGVGAAQIVFTSGATESIGLFLGGFTNAHPAASLRCLSVEHPAVLSAVKHYAPDAVLLPVDQNGVLALERIPPFSGQTPSLSCCMAVNNETGSVQPVAALRKLLGDSADNLLFCDAVQALGKIDLSSCIEAADVMVFSSHKCYGPKGVGALYVKQPGRWKFPSFGGGQEFGLRSGTENLAAIAGFVTAAEQCVAQLEQWNTNMRSLQSQFVQMLQKKIAPLRLNAALDQGVPSTVSLSLPGADGAAMVRLLSRKGVYVSTGSACHSDVQYPSHVLRAMGIAAPQALSSLRISLGRQTTAEQLEYAADQISVSYKRLSSRS